MCAILPPFYDFSLAPKVNLTVRYFLLSILFENGVSFYFEILVIVGDYSYENTRKISKVSPTNEGYLSIFQNKKYLQKGNCLFVCLFDGV